MTDTETPMRERIARAIATASSHELVEERWPTYLPDADAVLDAMREPSDAQVETAYEITEDCELWDIQDVDDFKRVWAAAIDAAKEGK